MEFFQFFTGFLWSFSSISNPRSSPNQLPWLIHGGSNRRIKAGGFIKQQRNKTKKGRKGQNMSKPRCYCILVGGILEPWNGLWLSHHIGVMSSSQVTIPPSFFRVCQIMWFHYLSSPTKNHEKPMISEVSLRTIRGGIPGFVLVSYKPLYHISLRISNETTICLSLNPWIFEGRDQLLS